MLRIRIYNMNCGGCAKGVRATLLAIMPSAGTHFDLDAKEVSVEALDAAPILAALRNDGWQAREGAG